MLVQQFHNMNMCSNVVMQSNITWRKIFIGEKNSNTRAALREISEQKQVMNTFIEDAENIPMMLY